MRLNLPSVATELESLGMERGPKFDKVVEDFFHMQLAGKGKTPEDRTKILRKLSGIKEVPKEGRKEKTGVKPLPTKGATKIETKQAAKVRAAAAAKGMSAGRPLEAAKKHPRSAASKPVERHLRNRRSAAEKAVGRRQAQVVSECSNYISMRRGASRVFCKSAYAGEIRILFAVSPSR